MSSRAKEHLCSAKMTSTDSEDADRVEAAQLPHHSRQAHKTTLEEFDGHLFAGNENFYGKFFTARPWIHTAEVFVRDVQPSDRSGNFHSSQDLAQWLARLQEGLPKRTALQCSWCEMEPGQSDGLGRAVVLSRSDNSRDQSDWANVLVIGHLQQPPDQDGLTQLCEYARMVFSSQPARVFLHGFYFALGKLQLWLFDRSAVYGSPAFDMAQAPDHVLTAIVGYMLMAEDEFGISNFVKRDAQGFQYLHMPNEDGGGSLKVCLGEPKIFGRVNGSLTGDGLNCYRARLSTSEHWEYAVKLKWSDPDDVSEFELLELVKKRRVWGVLNLVHHRVGGRTDLVREGLSVGDSGEDIKVLNCTVVSPVGNALHKYGSIPELLKALRDAVKAHRSLYLDGRILHRDINPANIIIPYIATDKADSTEPRGVLIDLDLASETSETSKQFHAVCTYIFAAIGVEQAYLPNNPHTYRHDLESFFYTFLFLAICPKHIAPGQNQLQLPESSVLRRWAEGRPVDKARQKSFDMDDANFGRILDEFTSSFRDLVELAKRLRELLFPMRDGELWTGTDLTSQGTNDLYDGIIQAFEMAVVDNSTL